MAEATTRVGRPADLVGLVGRELGETESHRVTQQAIDTFAEVTCDLQWIHLDHERAAAGPFGTTIAHGFLTLSLCSHFFGRLLEVAGAGMVVNYGLDRVRFPSPLPADTDVRATGVLVSADTVGDAIQTVARLTIQADGAPKPCCVADMVSRFYPEAA